jgi:16S rRNA (adenine(1408)-N(1))-methyltransferase
VHVDFGTGDGALARRAAAASATTLVIGVDASADGLREVSRRAARKPQKGGLPNARFGRLALDDAPGALAGLADLVTVVLPWGSLLGAVAVPRADGLARLAGLCRPGAELRVVFGYGPRADAKAIEELGLPSLDAPGALAALEARYREAGLSASVRPLPLDELRQLPTTWAKKLAFSGHERRFVEVRARVG